jgi:DNA-binding protein YbaB
MIVAASKEACKQIDKTTAQKMEKYSALTGGFGGLF